MAARVITSNFPMGGYRVNAKISTMIESRKTTKVLCSRNL